MKIEEKILLDKLSRLSTEDFEKEIDNLPNDENFTEDFNVNLRNLISKKYLSDLPENNTPFEESLEKWFNSLSKEDQDSFLNEDWSEFNNVK